MIRVNEIMTNTYLTASKLPDADFVINPYVGCPHKCIYCYAEYMKRFTNHSGEEWGDFLDVKKCNKTLNINSLSTDTTVLFGSVTDPYNIYEKKYSLTRSILSQMLYCEAQIEILTKSNLVVRDVDLFLQMKNIKVGISLNTLDDNFRRKIEPYASSVQRRLNALRELRNRGISTFLFISPIFPALTDFQELVDATKDYCDYICFENLNLRGAYMPRVLNFIRSNYQIHFDLYEKIYRSKDMTYWENMKSDIISYCSNYGIEARIYFYHDQIKKGGASKLRL
jgi:DNA repair photolyase